MPIIIDLTSEPEFIDLILDGEVIDLTLEDEETVYEDSYDYQGALKDFVSEPSSEDIIENWPLDDCSGRFNFMVH